MALGGISRGVAAGGMSPPLKRQKESDKHNERGGNNSIVKMCHELPEEYKKIILKGGHLKFRGVSTETRDIVDNPLKGTLNVSSVEEVRGILKCMTAMACVTPGFKEFTIQQKINYFTDNLNLILKESPQFRSMLDIIFRNLSKRDSEYFFNGCTQVKSAPISNSSLLSGWTYTENTTAIEIGAFVKKDGQRCGGIFKTNGLEYLNSPIARQIYTIYDPKTEQKILGVSLDKKHNIVASKGVTVVQTTPQANGVKLESRWENVNVGDKGEIVASEGVTVFQTTTDANGKTVDRWENVNVGDKGEIVASKGVTVVQTTTDANGKTVENRWENVNVGDKGAIVASKGVTRVQTTTKANGETEEHRWENVNVGHKGAIVASERVTKVQTTTKANGETEEHRWENVNVGDKGVIVASERVIRVQTTTKANGVKLESRFENINVGYMGVIVPSERVTKVQTTTDANGKTVENRWENVNVGEKGAIVGSGAKSVKKK